jgi:predicted ABC-type ATPase
MEEARPQLRIIAGPNGSGKTTIVRKFLPRYAAVRNFVNADLIAAGLSPFAPESVAITAARLMLAEVRRLLDQRTDFAFETTLSGKTYKPLLQQARDRGYTIFLYFLWLPDPTLNVLRVAQRVQEGGHNVPEADVRRRYQRGIRNFLDVYRPLADIWVVYENSQMWPREIAFAQEHQTTILDEATYQMFVEAGGKR